MTDRPLPPKQARFAEEYLVDLCATQAAIRAGYSEKTAKSQGQRLLTNVDIQKLIDQHQEARSHRVQMDADHVLQRLIEIDQMDVADILDDEGRVLPVNQWPGVWRRYATSIEVTEVGEGAGDDRQAVGLLKKVRWPDKLRNLELIGKHVDVQAWKERRELSGNLTMTHEEALDQLS